MRRTKRHGERGSGVNPPQLPTSSLAVSFCSSHFRSGLLCTASFLQRNFFVLQRTIFVSYRRFCLTVIQRNVFVSYEEFLCITKKCLCSTKKSQSYFFVLQRCFFVLRRSCVLCMIQRQVLCKQLTVDMGYVLLLLRTRQIP